VVQRFVEGREVKKSNVRAGLSPSASVEA